MPVKLTMEVIAKKFQSLKDKIASLEKEIKLLKEIPGTQNGWIPALRQHLNSFVRLNVFDNITLEVELIHVDKYLIKVIIPAFGKKGHPQKRMYPLNKINWIEGVQRGNQ